MPKLKDYEWEELTQNICMITFLQGLNIGGKIYNGYSIVPNNNNEDYVSEDSIYILDQNKEYHRATEQELLSTIGEDSVGVLNVDFERRMTTVTNENTHKSTTIYFYPKRDMASYNSIININNNNKNVYEYLEEASSRPSSDNLYKLAQIYYTALGRERYGMYRVTNKLEDVQELFRLD